MSWLCVVCICVDVLGNTKLPSVLLNCLDSLGVCWLLLLTLMLLLSTYVLYLHWYYYLFLLQAELVFLVSVVVEYEY